MDQETIGALKAAGAWAASGLLALLAWLTRRQVNRIDSLEERITKMIPRAEFEKHETKVEEGLRGVHGRLDKIYELLMQQRKE